MVARHPQLRHPTASAGLALLLAALGGCATAPPPPAATLDAPAQLFARAYTEIMEYYVEPRAPEQVALPGLQHLATVDPALAVAATGSEIVARDGAAVVARVAQPAKNDVRGWGAATAAVLDGIRAGSPAVAALTEDQREQAVFAGMTASLDRFSRYADPQQARDEHAARDGVDGVGAAIDATRPEMRISAIIPGSPAAHAGIVVGDIVVEIDGKATAGLSKSEVVERLRGPADSRVALALRREGLGELLHRTLSREFLVVPTVFGTRNGDIAILRIRSFNQHTTDALQDELARLRQQIGEARGIVLDLRGNPGGLLDQAVSVADLFMDGGRIVATRGRNSASSETFDASPGDIAAGLPMIVLVNGGSASAAEIVAAALQDSGRAVVVGAPSFGKGTVQTQLHLPNDGELTLTSARLYTPSGYLLHEHGVVPDLCTTGLADGGDDETLLRHRIAVLFGSQPRRPALDDAGWTRLRVACGNDSEEHPVETEAADRILGDPALFAALSRDERSTLAARPLPAKDIR